MNQQSIIVEALPYEGENRTKINNKIVKECMLCQSEEKLFWYKGKLLCKEDWVATKTDAKKRALVNVKRVGLDNTINLTKDQKMIFSKFKRKIEAKEKEIEELQKKVDKEKESTEEEKQKIEAEKEAIEAEREALEAEKIRIAENEKKGKANTAQYELQKAEEEALAIEEAEAQAKRIKKLEADLKKAKSKIKSDAGKAQDRLEQEKPE